MGQPISMKYQYKTIRLDNLPVVGNGHQLEKILNEEGQKGWELILVETSKPISINLLIFSTDKLHKETTLYFKKTIQR